MENTQNKELLTYDRITKVIGDLLYGPPQVDNIGTPIFDNDAVMEEPVLNKPGYINLRSKHINIFNVKKPDWDQALRDNAVKFVNSNP